MAPATSGSWSNANFNFVFFASWRLCGKICFLRQPHGEVVLHKNHISVRPHGLISENICKNNIIQSGLKTDFKISQSNFEEYKPKSDKGIIITNPPYNERMIEEDIVSFYKKIGDTLKQKFNGFDAWIISGNLDAAKFIGLKPSRKIKLINGTIECRFNKYELYSL